MCVSVDINLRWLLAPCMLAVDKQNRPAGLLISVYQLIRECKPGCWQTRHPTLTMPKVIPTYKTSSHSQQPTSQSQDQYIYITSTIYWILSTGHINVTDFVSSKSWLRSLKKLSCVKKQLYATDICDGTTMVLTMEGHAEWAELLGSWGVLKTATSFMLFIPQKNIIFSGI